MTQIPLLTVPEPKQPNGIDLRLCSVDALLNDMPGVPSLVIADPPWHYAQAPGHSANPENHYASMTDAEICAVLDRAYDVVDVGRLALWCTWPKLGQWFDAKQAGRWRWKYVSGGAWTKTGGSATGFHWLGFSEPVICYTKTKPGSPLCANWGPLQNAHTSYRQKHSEKPVEWMCEWVERWTEPGDLVLDLFAGMAPVARACARTGRRYVGGEIDPERYRQAVDRLALDGGR